MMSAKINPRIRRRRRHRRRPPPPPHINRKRLKRILCVCLINNKKLLK
jgi:hypothetical protein